MARFCTFTLPVRQPQNFMYVRLICCVCISWCWLIHGCRPFHYTTKWHQARHYFITVWNWSIKAIFYLALIVQNVIILFSWARVSDHIRSHSIAPLLLLALFIIGGAGYWYVFSGTSKCTYCLMRKYGGIRLKIFFGWRGCDWRWVYLLRCIHHCTVIIVSLFTNSKVLFVPECLPEGKSLTFESEAEQFSILSTGAL